MRLHRGLWAGACLLLALVGCGDKKKVIEGTGIYSPIITGISSSNEPAARDTTNLLTAQVTNVNNLALTYHWSAAAGTITDTTSATATWKAPNAIGFYDVTVSIEAQDGSAHFFRTMTVHMAVDNHFTRWTRSDAVQFDPAPVIGGGVLYAEFRNATTGSSDAYRVDVAMGGPSKLTNQFFSVSSPTPRADQVHFAFAAKKRAAETSPSIFVLPWGGGDTTNATLLSRPQANQLTLLNPRFSRQGTLLLYTSDSVITGYPRMWRRDTYTWTIPAPIFDLNDGDVFFQKQLYANWGPDSTGDGIPDYVICTLSDPFGAPTGLFTVQAAGNATGPEEQMFLSDPTMLEPDWSADGRHVIFAKRNNGSIDRDIWIINRAATDISQAIRVTSGPSDDSHPRFSADGSTIFFISNRVDHYGLNGIYGTERRGTNVWSVAHFDKP